MVVREETRRLNGWDLEAFQEAVTMVDEQPEAGLLTWRGHVTWDGGFGLDARTDEIRQLDQRMVRRFTLRGDHPPELLGENTGPTAVETLLAALGSCIAGTYAAQATAKGVEIERLEVEVEGRIDLSGFLQLRPTRAGLLEANAAIKVKSDADPEVLEELRQITTQASPVYDSVANPVSVQSTVERMEETAQDAHRESHG